MNIYTILCVIAVVELSLLIFQNKNKIATTRIMFFMGGAMSTFGYVIMSASSSVDRMMVGNIVSYIGGLTCLISMVSIIAQICQVKISNGFIYVLVGLAFLILYFVFTAPVNGLYYSDVKICNYNGIYYFSKIRGNAYYLMVLLMALSNILPFCIIFSSFKLHRKISYRTAVFLIAVLVLSSMVYAVPRITHYPLDLTPICYVLDMTLFFFVFKRADMYDMTNNLFAIYDDRDEYSYMCIDAKKRFMGATDGVYKIMPELSKQRIDEVVDKKAFNSAMPVQIVDWAEAYIDGAANAEKEKKFYQGDRRWDASIHELKGVRKKGYCIEFHDDTNDLKILEEIEKERTLAEDARKEAEAANISKSSFLAVVSHEIRTPLNAIVGMTDLLLKEAGSLTKKQSDYLQNIKTSGSSLVMIVNDILDQSKIEAGKMEIVPSIYEFLPIINDVRMIIENRIGNKDIELICSVDKNIPRYLVGDSLRIRQILINLMNNAVKFTESGYIKLHVEAVGSRDDKIAIRFAVEDSGQGIKAKDLVKLGAAFTQVDTRKNHSKEGTGLGLSISRDFIKMMGGQLSVSSEYGKGSEFYFTILQGITEDPIPDVASSLEKENQEFTMTGGRILVVDDTEFNLIVAREQLKTICDNVDIALNGEKAIELVANNRYDIIFMDYMMPYMDGTEVTEAIRNLKNIENFARSEEQAKYYENVTIVALTGDTSDEAKQKFEEVGINDFMEKPVNYSDFKKIIRKWVPEDMIKYKK